MDAQNSDWKVPIKLIDVKVSLASYQGDTLEIHTESFPSRNLENYCIISYVWSHEDKFAVDEICVRKKLEEPLRTRRTIESCSLASFVAMLDICDQMDMNHVWIDCVCVEQENHMVKSHQLAEMGYYYSCATRCLVFLNGLKMYIPPVFEGGNIGSWYDRVWIVQEAGYSFGKKTFVHALPPAPALALPEFSDIIAFLKIRAEHVDMISRSLTRNKHVRSTTEVCKVEDIPPVSKWSLGLVREENYSKSQGLAYKLSSEVPFCSCHDVLGGELSRKSGRALEVNADNITQIIREAMRSSRGCKFPQDRVYSIMTLLGIELEVSYEISLRDTICKAAKAMEPRMLVQFITATWYSQDGHALPDDTFDSHVVMSISNCITNVKVEGSDLLITTKTKWVTISFLAIVSNNFRQRRVYGSTYDSFGRACLLDGEVKARGQVDPMKLSYHQDPSDESEWARVQLLLMGKSFMKWFAVGSDGNVDMGRSGNKDVDANVCLVVRHVNGVWMKIGVLYVSEDLIFDPESEQLALKL